MRLISVELQTLQVVTLLDSALDILRAEDASANAAQGAAVYLFAACATVDRLTDATESTPDFCYGSCESYGSTDARFFRVSRLLKMALGLISGDETSLEEREDIIAFVEAAREMLLSIATDPDAGTPRPTGGAGALAA